MVAGANRHAGGSAAVTGVPWLELLTGVCAGLAAFAAVPPAGRAGGRGKGLRGQRSGPRGRLPRLPQRAGQPLPAPVLLDLVAEVLSGGAPVTRAVSAVGEALRAVDDPQAAEFLRLGARLMTGASGMAVPIGPGDLARAAPSRGGDRAPGMQRWFRRLVRRRPGSREDDPALVVPRLAEALDLALATGAGPVALIRAAAQEERRARAIRGVQSARRLGVLVLLPTGLCLLPAFLLLTIVPLAVSLALG
jgi:hypothetical protein